jgi:hypothetical protein
MQEQKIVYYDPGRCNPKRGDEIGVEGSKYLKAAHDWLQCESMYKKKKSLADTFLGRNDWTLTEAGSEQAMQTDGYDCGVIAILGIGLIADNVQMRAGLFNVRDGFDYRLKIGCDILRGRYEGYL